MPAKIEINPYGTAVNLAGAGLNLGRVFIGEPDKDPEAFPVAVFWDAAGTVPALQPIATIGGYTARSGSPAEVFGPPSYSIRVRDKNDAQIYYARRVSGPVSADDIEAPSGASMIGFSQGTAQATTRDLLVKARETISPDDYTGTSDSEKVSAAVTARRNLTLPAGSAYTIGDIPLSNSQSITGNGSVLNATTGATNLVVLSDYNPRVMDGYLSNTQNLSSAALRIDQSRFVYVSGLTLPNAKNGFLRIVPTNTSTSSASWGNIAHCKAETVEGTGIFIGSSSNDFTFSDISVFGQTGTGTGGYKPLAGSIGWDQNTPVVNGRAVGGHFITNLILINLDKGMRITDGQLTKFSNIGIDNCSDWALEVLGASESIDFADLFVGTTRGIRIAGSSQVSINGLRTIFNGLVPPGGASDFFDGTAWDVLLEDTAQLTISGGWRGAKKISVAPTAKLILDCGTKWFGRTGNVPAGETNYIFETGITPTEGDAVWRPPANGKVVGITVSPTAAPGASQSFTYTLRKGFADTSLVAAVSGASGFGGDFWSPAGIDCGPGDQIALKLVTSAGAAVTKHQFIIHFVAN